MIVDPKKTFLLQAEDVFFKIFRKLVSTTYRKMGWRHKTHPWITGDSFRALADHIHDKDATFNPTAVKLGDVVFVGNPEMRDYFVTIHPQISHPYILIQHNGDHMVDESIAKYIDEKIICFFAQIVLVAHPKIVPIPIGVANKYHGLDGFPRLMPKFDYPIIQRKPRIFYHFSVQTNPNERGPALEYFKTHPLMDTITSFVPFWTYKKILGSYCFTVSPAGNTLGSHRTWEALYLGTIPIVKRTVDAEYCESLGMPIWIVDNWHELSNYTEESLSEKFIEMRKAADFRSCYMDYWIERIHKTQRDARQTNN